MPRGTVDGGFRGGADQAAVNAFAGLGLVAPVGGGVAHVDEMAAQMHTHDRVKLLVGHAEDGLVATETGVVDHDVQITEGVQCRFHQRVCVPGVGAVTQNRERFAAEGANLLRGGMRCFFRVGPVDVIDNDARALAGELYGLFTAKPAACAGNDGNLACQVSHVAFSC